MERGYIAAVEQISGPRTRIVRQRSRWTIRAGIGIVVMVLGLAASLAAQPTISGKITAVVFFCLFIALILWLWRRQNRWRDQLEITPDAIGFRHGRGGGPSIALTREHGTDLRLIPALRGHGEKCPNRRRTLEPDDLWRQSEPERDRRSPAGATACRPAPPGR